MDLLGSGRIGWELMRNSIQLHAQASAQHFWSEKFLESDYISLWIWSDLCQVVQNYLNQKGFSIIQFQFTNSGTAARRIICAPHSAAKITRFAISFNLEQHWICDFLLIWFKFLILNSSYINLRLKSLTTMSEFAIWIHVSVLAPTSSFWNLIWNFDMNLEQI